MKLQSFTGDYLERLKQFDPAAREHFAAYFHEWLYLKYRWHSCSAELEDIQRETLSRVLDAVGRGDVRHPERFDAFVLSVSSKVGRELARQRLRKDPEAPLILEQRRREMEAILNGLTATVDSLQALFGKSK